MLHPEAGKERSAKPTFRVSNLLGVDSGHRLNLCRRLFSTECIAEWFEKKKRKRAAELSALDAAEDDSVVNGAE
jgi:trehalose utilization protein